MVDSVSNPSLNSLVRAQQLAAANNVRAPNQTIITQAQKTSVAPAKASAVSQTSKAVGPQSSLPRGSLVDRLV